MLKQANIKKNQVNELIMKKKEEKRERKYMREKKKGMERISSMQRRDSKIKHSEAKSRV